MFESPAKKFPSTFGKIQFFHEFPYALPSFMVAGVGVVCVVVTAVFVREVRIQIPFPVSSTTDVYNI